MVQFNTKEKELIIKIVYYGPGLSGKTTNLKHIHRTTDPDKTTKLISLNTENDRTLFFDLLPYEIGNLSGMKIKLQLYTVPGQAQYKSTRKAVLNGSDGIVFVADSQRYMMTANIENMKDMIINCRENNININNVPLVLQYNKRDLPKISSVNELNNILNKRNVPSFEAVALNGEGVFETLKQVLYNAIDHIIKEYEISVIQSEVQNIKKLIEKNLGRFYKNGMEDEKHIETEQDNIQEHNYDGKTPMKEINTSPVITINEIDVDKQMKDLENQFLDNGNGQGMKDPSFKTEETIEEVKTKKPKTVPDLIEKAVDSNIKISQLYVQVDDVKRQLNQKVKELAVLNQVSNLMASNEEVPEILKRIFKYAMEAKMLQHGSLLVPKKDGYKQLICVGFEKDPINNINTRENGNLLNILSNRKNITAVNVLNSSTLIDLNIQDESWIKKIEELEIDSFLIAPLISKGNIHGVFNFYRVNSPFDFSKDDVEFINSLAAQAAMVIENTKLKHKSGKDESVKIQNFGRVLLVIQKRLQGNIGALNNLHEYFSSSAQTHLELLVKNEKEMNKKLLKSINDIINKA